ncbi:MAG: flagellar hook-basal body complex protein FliE [Burkholderiaceae bacterium]|nr:flagellar hook-basal body complex protein FliE [Burkholderiaceae bacterium]
MRASGAAARYRPRGARIEAAKGRYSPCLSVRRGRHLPQLKALAQDGTMQIGSINAQLAQAVASIKAPAAATGAAAAGGSDFVSSLDAALKNVSRNQQTSSELQRQFQLENPNVSLEQTMIAMNQSSLSFQAAVQVRNRLVQAYEQIMQMPV